jgi:hypothetical protein
MKKIILVLLAVSQLAMAQTQFPQYLFCISWLGYKTELHQKKLSEYATAEITHSNGPWTFSVDVIENKLNSLILVNTEAQVKSQSHSTDFPFEHLALRLEVLDQVSSVDCELRFFELKVF